MCVCQAISFHIHSLNIDIPFYHSTRCDLSKSVYVYEQQMSEEIKSHSNVLSSYYGTISNTLCASCSLGTQREREKIGWWEKGLVFRELERNWWKEYYIDYYSISINIVLVSSWLLRDVCVCGKLVENYFWTSTSYTELFAFYYLQKLR